ncbi:MAG: QueT transporter family protein [Clostridia bacterium]|nr:QueT transporter family protein [Clostridia bacterium]MDD4146767.1 QueT transporter family protein [Clostridia bacterium]MDD4666041.1 QueT transporter family protein [Clostridia bacterium]
MQTKKVVRVSAIAALYAAITIVFAPLSYGVIQVRISEALTVLPFIFPESVLGLFVGCLLANIYGGLGFIDIVFGSLATLLAAYFTSKMPHALLAPLPPVLINAVVVACVLKYVLGYPFLLSMFYVGLGEFLACYFLGLPLLYLLKKYKSHK